MKVFIAYPPLHSHKGCPTVGQNRQFQYFKEPTYIYPVVPASAATLLSKAGHQVRWVDSQAQQIPIDEFYALVKDEKPDLIALESKTPIIKQLWKICDQLKVLHPQIKVALFGDHVTALPQESLQNSQVDFVLTGGDYDFLLLNLCEHVQSAGQKALKPGIYYRDRAVIKNTGTFILDHDLNTLPFIDRELTRWQDYAVNNGNYKRTPGAYIMSGRDCWWGKCSFCSWPTLYPHYRVRSVSNVLDEIQDLVERYHVREIMDDSGCFSAGEWLREFCQGIIARGLHKKVYLDCNMRFGALKEPDFALMKKANFRLLLFGLESANQNTLERINKQVSIESIARDCKAATRAGLYPHITLMFGYPWETYDDALATLHFGQELLKKGDAYTMQATIVIPYPGTKLFDECKKNDQLLTLDWDEYDMKRPVMRMGFAPEKLMKLVQGMYGVSFDLEFMMRKLCSLRDIDDVRYFGRAAKKVAGHIFDFKKHRAAGCGCS